MTNPPVQSRFPQCELCGGTFVGGLGLTGAHKMGLHPHRKTLWANPMSSLSAVVCLGCGNAKFFTDDLAKIREHAQRHPEDFVW